MVKILKIIFKNTDFLLIILYINQTYNCGDGTEQLVENTGFGDKLSGFTFTVPCANCDFDGYLVSPCPVSSFTK